MSQLKNMRIKFFFKKVHNKMFQLKNKNIKITNLKK